LFFFLALFNLHHVDLGERNDEQPYAVVAVVVVVVAIVVPTAEDIALTINKIEFLNPIKLAYDIKRKESL